MSTGEFRQISVKIGEKSAACEKSAKCSKKSPRPNFGLYRRFFTDFSGNFPIFPTSPVRAQDTKSVQFFYKKKQKMLFGNLIMICRQRLCFSVWLKNRGFRVREI